MRPPLVTWVCPRCGWTTQQRGAITVTHRCIIPGRPDKTINCHPQPEGHPAA